MSDHFYLDYRPALAERHITLTINGEEWPAYIIGPDPEWYGWQRVRVTLPEGEGVVCVREGEA